MSSTHIESEGGIRVTIQHCEGCDVFLGVNYPFDTCNDCINNECAPDCQERADCQRVGQSGHSYCGFCAACDMPVHHCGHTLPRS